MDIVISSKNLHKIKELKELLYGKNFSILTAVELNCPEVVEDGLTLMENAKKKAVSNALFTGKLTIADDTGFFINALNNEPGIYAARYAGKDCNFSQNIKKVLKKLSGHKDRTAYFESVVVLADTNGFCSFGVGKCFGKITEKEIGEAGFGYDPIFIPDGTNKTFAQMSLAEKNIFSHRRKALDSIYPKILEYIKR